jgi:hypothetical protein
VGDVDDETEKNTVVDIGSCSLGKPLGRSIRKKINGTLYLRVPTHDCGMTAVFGFKFVAMCGDWSNARWNDDNILFF